MCYALETEVLISLHPERRDAPGVSVYDVLRIYAANFVRVGSLVEKCVGGLMQRLHPEALAATDVRKAFNDLHETISRDHLELDLPVTAEIASNYIPYLDESTRLSFQSVARAAVEIYRAYQAEIRKKLMLHIASERARFLESDCLFGEAVDSAFPSSAQEIRDAGTCYALEQDTACVMHLMRALETPLATMATEFGVSSARENWNVIIEQVQSRVNALGPSDGADWKDRQEFYSSVCAQFMHFKNAWRNHAMHKRERYGGPQAKRIMDGSEHFMQILAARLHE